MTMRGSILGSIVVAVVAGAITVVAPPALAVTTDLAWASVGDRPSSIAVDSSGNVYTADFGSATVSKITPDGVVTAWWTGSGASAITVDASDNVYVADNLSPYTVTKIDPAGNEVWQRNTDQTPVDIAVDSSGNVYTANEGPDTITKITSAGVVTTVWASTDVDPYGIAVDSSGNVYTANNGSDTVQKFAPNGTLTWRANTGSGPWHVALDSSGNVYTSNLNVGTISKITPDGSPTASWATTGDLPLGIRVDCAGSVYTTNYGPNTITKVTADGATTLAWSNTGSQPYDLIISSTGIVYTANRGDDTVTRVTDTDITCGGDSPDTIAGPAPTFTFTFLTSGGGRCLPDVTVTRFERFTLPPASVACTPLSTSMAGWSIPGQDWAFAPGRVVTVVDSQVFTAVAREPEITITYDSNVDMGDACIADNVNIAVESDRYATVPTPRLGPTATLATSAPCTPPGFTLMGWTNANTPEGSGQAQQRAQTYKPGATIPDAWNLGTPNPVNVVRLYALWQRSGA